MALQTVIVEGLKFKIDTDIFDDFEFLELYTDVSAELPELPEDPTEDELAIFNEMSSKQTVAILNFAKFVLGDKLTLVKEHIRKKNKGRVPIKDVFVFIENIVKQVDIAKK